MPYSKQQVIDKIEELKDAIRAAKNSSPVTLEQKANVDRFVKQQEATIRQIRFNFAIWQRGELRDIATHQAKEQLQELMG